MNNSESDYGIISNKEKTDYVKTYDRGNIYFVFLPKFMPLLVWGFLIWKYYYPYMLSNIDQHKYHIQQSIFFICILSIPFLLFIIELISNRTKIFSKEPLVPITWPTCFTQTPHSKNIVGIWDNQCGANETAYVQRQSYGLLYSFYYLNFALFLLLLSYSKLTSFKRSASSSMHIIFVCIALFIGTLGVLPLTFSNTYMHSLILLMGYGTLLNMNIAAFLVVLYAVGVH